MTKVAIVAGTYRPEQCGVAHYTAHLRDVLAQRGVASAVISTKNAALAAADATVIGAVTDWHLTDLRSLVEAIHRTKADILHIQHAAGTYGFDRAIFLLPPLLRLTGWRSPIVTTIHEYGWWEWQPQRIPPQLMEWLKTWGQQRGWWDREDGFLLTNSDAIITTNSDAKRVIYDRLPHLKQRVWQIPIGANVDVAPMDRAAARHQVRHECGWSNDVAIAAFFGFLHPVKGLETLLPAFKQVLATHPQTRLLLVGGVESLALPNEQATHYWNKLQTLIAELSLSETVHMTGYVDVNTVSRYLLASDIGVLPFNHGVTLKSGSLLALMAHSLPVIATYATPPDPELNDAHLVRAIAPRDVESLTTELNHLLADPLLRDRLATAGHSFSRQFAWSSIADAHLDIYHALCRNISSQRSTPIPLS